MNIADVTIEVYDAVHRHTTEFEKIHFLLVQLRDTVAGVWHSNEGKPFTLPITLKLLKSIGTYSE